jgi:hypothetical protein|tara:strand:+ start:823 stop:1020 length:198 start_codon:yes stop_codon:yes gene_type:complete
MFDRESIAVPRRDPIPRQSNAAPAFAPYMEANEDEEPDEDMFQMLRATNLSRGTRAPLPSIRRKE